MVKSVPIQSRWVNKRNKQITPPCLFVSLTMLLWLCFCFYDICHSVLLLPPLCVQYSLSSPWRVSLFSSPSIALHSLLWLLSFFNSLFLSCASLVFVFAVLVHHVEEDLFWGRNYVQWIINNNSSNTTEWEEAIERDTSCIIQPNELPL